MHLSLAVLTGRAACRCREIIDATSCQCTVHLLLIALAHDTCSLRITVASLSLPCMLHAQLPIILPFHLPIIFCPPPTIVASLAHYNCPPFPHSQPPTDHSAYSFLTCPSHLPITLAAQINNCITQQTLTCCLFMQPLLTFLSALYQWGQEAHLPRRHTSPAETALHM